MTRYWSRDTEKGLARVDWTDDESIVRFFSGLSEDENESFILQFTQHLPSSGRSEGIRGAGYIWLLAKAQHALQGTEADFFADGRLEDWLIGWLAYSASDKTSIDFEQLLDRLLAVENEIGSDRAGPVVADLIRGTVSGRDVPIWHRFKTVLAVCRTWREYRSSTLPAAAPVIEALVSILDDDRFPPKEGSADLWQRRGIRHLAAMALLEIGDPVGLRGLIDAWFATTSEPARSDRHFPNFPLDVVNEGRVAFGLGYPKDSLPGLPLKTEDIPFPILTGNAEVLG